ncbi:siderophore-interacting protein [Rhizobium sp. AU243]|uniref:siderophore-interacting protein n=1 Tax=Rhizobium sp. AU243 TaxID=2303425 RepID=UPI0010CC03C9|nr:siderophore-interacting protein [Rhizobium sp. AU243]TKV71306.1 siderophore-interacting protein [Rhizobium sp. AU243]
MTILTDESFRILTVVDSQRVAPFMQRLRFSGTGLQRFDTLENLHVRLYFSKRSKDFIGDLPAGENVAASADAFDVRYYTIRAIDADSGFIDIDFVLHEDAGPGCSFARNARPGALCGMSGPCGLGMKPAKHYLLAGDETALPAIARICENLPENATGRIFLRAENCRYGIAAPSGIQICWLPRSTVCPMRFVERVGDAALETAASNNEYFLWLANAFSQWQCFRDKLTVLSKKRYLNACYWRDDMTTSH